MSSEISEEIFILETCRTLFNHKGATVQRYCCIQFKRFITHPLPSAHTQPQLLLWKYKHISLTILCYYNLSNRPTWCHRKHSKKTVCYIDFDIDLLYLWFLSWITGHKFSVVCSIFFHQRSLCRKHHNKLCRGRQRQQQIHW